MPSLEGIVKKFGLHENSSAEDVGQALRESGVRCSPYVVEKLRGTSHDDPEASDTELMVRFAYNWVKEAYASEYADCKGDPRQTQPASEKEERALRTARDAFPVPSRVRPRPGQQPPRYPDTEEHRRLQTGHIATYEQTTALMHTASESEISEVWHRSTKLRPLSLTEQSAAFRACVAEEERNAVMESDSAAAVPEQPAPQPAPRKRRQKRPRSAGLQKQPTSQRAEHRSREAVLAAALQHEPLETTRRAHLASTVAPSQGAQASQLGTSTEGPPPERWADADVLYFSVESSTSDDETFDQCLKRVLEAGTSDVPSTACTNILKYAKYQALCK